MSFIQRILLFQILVCFAAAAGAQSYPDQVVIILDGSASMRETMSKMNVTKMEAAKDALKTVLTQITRTTNVGLLVFSTRTLGSPWVQEPGPVDPKILERAIDGVVADGGTPLGEFIKIGVDKLLEIRAKQFGYGSYRLLVVTDGEASDKELMDAYAPEVSKRGITMDVIGVDMDREHTLSKIAHAYRSADDPSTLKHAIQATFAEVSSGGADASAAQPDFELLSGISVELASSMIEALAIQDNSPIGKKEPARPAAPKAAAPVAPAPKPVQAPPPPISTQSDFPISPIWIGAGIIFLLFLIRSKNSGRR